MATTQAARAATDERVTLHGVSWGTYEALLRDHADASAPRFTYDHGTLEIVMPHAGHERPNRLLNLLVEIIAEERDLDVESLGSTTFKLELREQGFEPDSCFYIEHAAAMRGKVLIDPRVDPPPELVIEIDPSRSSLPKLSLFAAFSVPEVWRYRGDRVVIRVLEGGAYAERAESRALPGVTADDLARLVARGEREPRPAWLRRVRDWARGIAQELGATETRPALGGPSASD